MAPPKGCLVTGFEELQSKVSIVVIWYNPSVIHFWVAFALCVIEDFIKNIELSSGLSYII